MTNEKLDRLKARILQTVTEYGAAYGPCPMTVLSSKYSKASLEFGGVSSVVDDLKNDGAVFVFLTKTGRKIISIDDKPIDDAVKI